jgi:hypothetical protein
VEPADDVDLVDVGSHVRLDLGFRHRVRARVARLLGVVAEAAREHADVGGIELAIDREVDAIAVAIAREGVRQEPELEHRRVRTAARPLPG